MLTYIFQVFVLHIQHLTHNSFFKISEFDKLFDPSFDQVVVLKCCISCYQCAIQLTPRLQETVYVPLIKREGNAWNELGVCLMQSAQQLLEKSGEF